MRNVIRAAIFGALLGTCAISAQAADPADVTFWQSIQNSKNAAEYQAYLNAFPQGEFAELAKARMKEFGAPGAGGPALGAVVGKGIITVTPAAVDVGEQVSLSFTKFPKQGPFDQIVVDPAGTPDAASNTAQVYMVYFNNPGQIDSGMKVGPFAPGTYEVRWLTTLYNNQSKQQVGARAQFTVNP